MASLEERMEERMASLERLEERMEGRMASLEHLHMDSLHFKQLEERMMPLRSNRKDQDQLIEKLEHGMENLERTWRQHGEKMERRMEKIERTMETTLQAIIKNYHKLSTRVTNLESRVGSLLSSETSKAELVVVGAASEG